MPSWPTTGVGSGWNQGTGTGEIEFALKHFYLPGMEEQKNNARVLLANIQRNEKDVSGDFAYVPIMLGRNWGIGMRANRQPLPDAGYQRGVRTQIPMKYDFGQLIVTLHAMSATRNSQGSYETVLDVETEGLMEDLPKDINRQLFGDGTGVIGEINGTPGATTFVVDNATASTSAPHNTNELTKYFEVGQRLDTWTPGGTQHNGVSTAVPSMTVTGVNPLTNTITVDATTVGAGGAADNDYVYLAGNRNLEVTGLQGAISASNTYQTVDRTAAGNERWKANVISTSGDITEDLLQQADTAAQKASGMTPNLIIGTYELRDKYASILQGGRRFVNTIEYKGGFKGPEFSGRGLVPDPDAPRGKVWFLNTDYMAIYQQAGLQFMNEDGAILSRKSGYAAYEATLYWFFELGMRRSNVSSLISGVNQ